ncbi:LacI family DNA-binding transcriptional regulator [Rhizobium sp. Rhizsp82]|uniref:LacI family DNA-binding transcriptional regulator n=1 Tax=Rhizobium sp. Rhizsp82 TaxID=3243057 RepID=UPI0039B5E67D
MDETDHTAGRKRGATIIDVAKVADVAVGTVSRYLNGQTIRRSNREQIERAIQDLGYKRNAAAASIRTDLTHMIGFLVPTFDEFHARMLEHLANSVRRTGRALLTYCHGGDPRVVAEALDFFAAQRVDALIMDGTAEVYDRVDDLINHDIPIIFYNNDVRGLGADRVMVENHKASYRLVSHLIDLGHRRIGILTGDPRNSSGIERLAGYEQALRERGIAPDPALAVRGNWRMDGGYEATKRLMSVETPPTAIFSANYGMAVGALSWLKENGRHVPEDVSLASFDDVAVFRLYEAGITAVAQPVASIAETITDILVERLAEPAGGATRSVVLECDIILRGSTRRVT